MNTQRIPKGLAFGRLVKSLIVGRGVPHEALAYCEGQGTNWTDTPGVKVALKAAVSAVSTSDAEALAAARPLATEFLELVRPRSLIDRIVGLRQVPANVSMLKVSNGATAFWVGEGAPKPVGKFSLDRETLRFNKLVSLIIVTNELMKGSSLVAEMAFTEELARGIAAQGDRTFVDPASAPVAGISPGSIAYGIAPIASSGASLAQVQADIKALFAGFTAADGALEEAVIVMHPHTALALSLLTGSGGAPAFPNLGARGGFIAGVPVFVTSAASSSATPGQTFMVLFDPHQILIADDNDVTVTTSEHASVQMSDSPLSGATTLVPLWQNSCRGVLAERFVTWKRTNDTGVAVLTGITY